MNTWIITDTHFGHTKMVEYCGRPLDFEDRILRSCTELVKENDTLIHLGDFCIGRDSYWHETFMSRVKGRKWLVRGNHDGNSNQWYLEHGWDWVGAKFQDKFFGKNILFSHTPVRYQVEQSGLYISDSFDINIHGHFHNTMHRLLEGKYVVEGEKERNVEDIKKLSNRHMLLAVEYTNYQPVLLKTFLDL